jgi:hypothetical protein
VSYGVRALVKQAGGTPWTVLPLEGPWWGDVMPAFTAGSRNDWFWTMMIAQPEVVTADLIEQAVSAAVAPPAVGPGQSRPARCPPSRPPP